MKIFFLQLAAAVTFFTRIPLWRWVNIPSEYFSEIIYLWPLTGWITGGVTALAWWGFSSVFPPMLAIILALGVRVLLTGGLHEDGLGDFIDGFGGGKNKDDILRIMKDSHTGNYALVGLIFYYLIITNLLVAFPLKMVWMFLLVGDPLSKMLTALMMNFLPYARTASESKSQMLYKKLGISQLSFMIIVSLLPFSIFVKTTTWIAVLAPIFLVIAIGQYSKKKIGGYTGDVCGATVILAELSYYVFSYLIFRLIG
jgi:adenosylcobinamide-GDP ribazoletransferase